MAMDEQYLPPTTQRAYTLRLRPAISANDSPEERQRKTAEMQSALWATHDAVNRGAKTFGDWLLTLRGGLDHNRAAAKVKDKKSERDPTQEEIKNRRILLALSWLCVEDEHGAQDHPEYIVAYGEECQKQQDNQDSRDRKVLAALRDILAARCVPDQEIGSLQEPALGTWLADCKQSLSAAIRPDAVWVNRSKLFDEITDAWDADGSKKRNDAWTLLSFLFKDEFLTIPAQKAAESNDDAESEDESSKRQAAFVASSKGAGQRTRHPFGHLLGQGKPFGNPTRVLNYRDGWHEYLHPLLSGTGIPLVSEAEKKTRKNSQDESYSHTELQREMFSKAASRLAQTITKLRQQEQERQSDNAAREALETMEASSEYSDALTILRRYCREYQNESGSADEFYLLPRQIAGWDRVINRWLSIKLNDKDAIIQARVDTVKELQADSEDKKFGDVNLFIRLAGEEYESVWKHKGKADASVLKIFVEGEAAKRAVLALKVPTYRHPDPYNNPIFCQFGVSRPHIQFRRLMQTADEPSMNDMHAVRMLLWHPHSNHAKRTVMLGMSKRLDYEIGSVPNQTERDDAQPISVPRKGRLGFAAAGRTDTQTPTKVAGIFDVKRIEKRGAPDEDDEETEGKFKQPTWNGTLSTDRFQLRRIGRTKSHAKAKEFISKLQWTLTVSIELETRGPWPRYIAQNNKSAFLRTIRKDKPRDTDDLSKGFTATKGEQYIEWSRWPWQELNKPLRENPSRTALVDNTRAARGAKASLMLSRLPNLRLLSVDLGHRFAAAGAVWQALSLAEFFSEIELAKSQGARIDGNLQGLYVHVIRKREKLDKKRQIKIIEESTIYRRIGTDEIVDLSNGELIAHPAPWARLDRQFLIKLQGEERSARRATPEEEELVCRMEHALGRVRDTNDKDDALPKQIDDLQWEAVRTAHLALRRHGDRARIAFAMTAAYKPTPGDRKFFFEHKNRETWDQNDGPVERHQKHIEFLRDSLNLWHQLFTSASWQDEAAKLLWETHIASLPNYQQPEELPDDLRGAERKKKRGENLDHLRPAAEALLNDNPLRSKLHDLWRERWELDDATWRGKEGHLRKLQDWIRPSKNAAGESIRNVGGLSLQRLATLTVVRADGTERTYNPSRQQGVSVYREEPRSLSVGDRIQFTAPANDLKVANRELATIESIGRDGRLSLRMDGGREVALDPRQHPHLDHGYAVTSHSSQGQTAERVLINVDTDLGARDLLNSRMAYVSVSRGAHDAQLFTNDREKLPAALGHEVSRESAHVPAHTPEQSIAPQQEIGPRHEQGPGFGIGF